MSVYIVGSISVASICTRQGCIEQTCDAAIIARSSTLSHLREASPYSLISQITSDIVCLGGSQVTDTAVTEFGEQDLNSTSSGLEDGKILLSYHVIGQRKDCPGYDLCQINQCCRRPPIPVFM